ncbi:MAG: nucleotidyltransferase domain-containing protein [Candidatus Nanohaloarchaea archaeon]
MFTEMDRAEIEVLEPFFFDPDLEASVRGLAKKTDISASSVSEKVKRLEERELLGSKKVGPSKQITVGKKFRNAKRIWNVDQISNSGLVETLEQQLKPDAIILFGSYEKGEDMKGSDIDVALVNGRDDSVDLSTYEKHLKREISLERVARAEEGDKGFRNSLANGTVLSGYLKVV